MSSIGNVHAVRRHGTGCNRSRIFCVFSTNLLGAPFPRHRLLGVGVKEDVMNQLFSTLSARGRKLRATGLLLGGLAAASLCSSAQLSASGADVLSSERSVLVTAALDPAAVSDAAAPLEPGPSVPSSSSLPDAPLPHLHKLNAPPASPSQAQHIAPIYESTIPAGWHAQKQDLHDKEIMGIRDLYSFDSLGAIALSAGYAHITNGQPNYGVTSKAFGQRLGAAAARETSQNVFTEMVFAPLLHEDARYYVLGPSANPIKRLFYAGTRPLITRTDGGRSTVNGSLLAGYAVAAAITPAYYPQSNRNFHDVLATYGASIGGAALGDLVNEFADDVLQAFHLRRLP